MRITRTLITVFFAICAFFVLHTAVAQNTEADSLKEVEKKVFSDKDILFYSDSTVRQLVDSLIKAHPYYKLVRPKATGKSFTFKKGLASLQTLNFAEVWAIDTFTVSYVGRDISISISYDYDWSVGYFREVVINDGQWKLEYCTSWNGKKLSHLTIWRKHSYDNGYHSFTIYGSGMMSSSLRIVGTNMSSMTDKFRYVTENIPKVALK